MNVIIGDSSKIMLISIKGCFLIFCAVNKVRDDDSILFSLRNLVAVLLVALH